MSGGGAHHPSLGAGEGGTYHAARGRTMYRRMEWSGPCAGNAHARGGHVVPTLAEQWARPNSTVCGEPCPRPSFIQSFRHAEVRDPRRLRFFLTKKGRGEGLSSDVAVLGYEGACATPSRSITNW